MNCHQEVRVFAEAVCRDVEGGGTEARKFVLLMLNILESLISYKTLSQTDHREYLKSFDPGLNCSDILNKIPDRYADLKAYFLFIWKPSLGL
jgi:hypothetical protein